MTPQGLIRTRGTLIANQKKTKTNRKPTDANKKNTNVFYKEK